jgi:phage terminase large subunit GpA-like protein
MPWQLQKKEITYSKWYYAKMEISNVNERLHTNVMTSLGKQPLERAQRPFLPRFKQQIEV